MTHGFTQGIFGAVLRGVGILLFLLWILVTHDVATFVLALMVYLLGSFLGYQSSHTVYVTNAERRHEKE